MKMKAIVTSLASVTLLYGCNSGNSATTPQPTTTPDAVHESMVPNPMLINFDARKKSDTTLKTAPADDATAILQLNNAVRIGYGYSPDTGQAIRIDTDPKNWTYTLNESEVSAFIADPCVYNDYAKEIGSVVSNDFKETFSSHLGVGTNIGLIKAKLAAGVDFENNNSKGDSKITKMVGASEKCLIRTPAYEGDHGNSANFAYMAEAISNASPKIREAIAKIQMADTTEDRQALIQNFYKFYGTYVVTSVEVSENAVKKIVMTEKHDSTQQSIAGSGAVEITAPFISGTLEISKSDSKQFDSKNWDFQIYNGVLPAGNTMEDKVKTLTDSLETAQKGGIIKFDALVPAALEKPTGYTPIKAPETNKEYKEKRADLTKKIDTLRDLVNKVDVDTASKPVTVDAQIAAANRAVANAKQAIALSEELYTIENVGFLSDANLKLYKTNLLPRIEAWSDNDLVGLYEETLIPNLAILAKDPTNVNAKQNVDDVKDTLIAIQEYKAEKITEEELADKVQAQANKDAIAKKLVQGSTYSDWLFKKYYITNPSNEAEYKKANTREDENNLFNAWLSKQTLETSTKWKNEYAQFYKITPVQQTVPQSVADSFKISAADQDKFSQGDIYAGRAVTNFGVRQWADIFPVLNQGFGINDGVEINQSKVLTKLTEFNNVYLYLLKMAAIDNTLYSTVLTKNTSDTFNLIGTDTGLRGQIIAGLHSSDKEIIYNGVKYNLADDASCDKLITAFQTLINNTDLYKSEWFKATKALMDKKLIGNFGSFAGLQPEGQDYYSLITNSFVNADGQSVTSSPVESFPSLAVVEANNAKYNMGPFRLIAQGIVKFAKDVFKGKQEVPTGVMQGTLRSLGLDDYTYQHVYTTYQNAATPATLALRSLPANDPAEIVGVLPIVLSKTRLVGNNISDLGLLDGKGRIWGANTGTNTSGITFTNDTVTYNLDLSNIAPGAVSPAYKITSDSGKVAEFRWAIDGKNDNEKNYNKYIIGASLSANQFLPKFDADFKNGGNSEFATYYKENGRIESYNCRQVWVRKTSFFTDEYRTECDTRTISDAFFFKGAGGMSGKYLSGDSGNISINWDPMNKNQVVPEQVTAKGYRLVLSPIDSSALQMMGNTLSNQARPQQPLLPRFLDIQK